MTALLHSMEHMIGREVGKVVWGSVVALLAGWQVWSKVRKARNRKDGEK